MVPTKYGVLQEAPYILTGYPFDFTQNGSGLGKPRPLYIQNYPFPLHALNSFDHTFATDLDWNHNDAFHCLLEHTLDHLDIL